MTELTGQHGETEQRRRETEESARQQAGAAGLARDGKNGGNTNVARVVRLRFRRSFRRVTRFAGLARAAAFPLRFFSVSPCLRVEPVLSVPSVPSVPSMACDA